MRWMRVDLRDEPRHRRCHEFRPAFGRTVRSLGDRPVVTVRRARTTACDRCLVARVKVSPRSWVARQRRMHAVACDHGIDEPQVLRRSAREAICDRPHHDPGIGGITAPDGCVEPEMSGQLAQERRFGEARTRAAENHDLRTPRELRDQSQLRRSVATVGATRRRRSFRARDRSCGRTQRGGKNNRDFRELRQNWK